MYNLKLFKFKLTKVNFFLLFAYIFSFLFIVKANAERINIIVNTNIFNLQTIDLSDYVDLKPYVGYRITSMVINGSAIQFGNSSVDLYFNDRLLAKSNMFSSFNQFKDIQMLFLPILNEKNSLTFQVSNQFEVYKIFLDVQKNTPN